MIRLKQWVLRLAARLGLYDDCKTEIHHRRAAWNAENDGELLALTRKEVRFGERRRDGRY